MRTITLFIITTLLVVTNFSCVGPAGRDGFDGVDGKDGIANVGAAIYDIEPSSWKGNIDGFTTSLIVPEIDQYVYENGAVLVYILKNENSDEKSFNQLPYTWLNGTMTEYFDYDAYIGRIDVTFRWVDNGINNTEAPDGTYTFKVIVIEGTPLSILKEQVDVSDPEAVMNLFNNPVMF